MGCTGARQTMVLVDGDGRPLGPAIVWSDRRAGAEARRMRRRGPVWRDRPRPPTGIPLDAASVAAKLAWLRAAPGPTAWPPPLGAGPRDLVVRWLTGVVATDPTMASRSGLYDLDGRVDPALAGSSAGLLAPVVPSDRSTGPLTGRGGRPPGPEGRRRRWSSGPATGPARSLGSGATEDRPMVSWGTTANVSVPLEVAGRPGPRPGVVLSRGGHRGMAAGGWAVGGRLPPGLDRATDR